jgi:hypothetical protein
MKSFKEFNIKPALKHFVGDKIKITKVEDREIIIHDWKLEESKFEGKGKCLYLQIEIDGAKRVVFTGSTVLIQEIEQVPMSEFPITATIVEVDEHYEFK